MMGIVVSAVPFSFAHITWELFNGASLNTSEQIMKGDFSGGWNVKWSTSFSSGGSYENYAQFVIADVDNDGANEVIGSYSSYIVSMNGSTGAIEWQFLKSGTGWLPAPAVGDINNDGLNEVITDDDRLGSNQVVALRGTNGSVLWRTNVGGVIYSSPKIYDINGDGFVEVVIGSDDGKVYVLRGLDGSLLCNYTTGGAVRSTAALLDNRIVIGSFDGKVYALDANCNLVWSYTTGGSVWSSPAMLDINGDYILDVIIGSGDGRVYALNGLTGGLIWSYNTGCEVRSAPAVGDVDQDGFVEVIAGNVCGKVVSLTANTGTLEWSYTVSGRGVYPYGSIGLADLLPAYNGLEILVLMEPSAWSSNDSYLLSSSGTLIRTFAGYGDGFAIGDADNDGCVEVMIECDGCASGKDVLYDSPTNSSSCGILTSDGELDINEFNADQRNEYGVIYTVDGRKTESLRRGVYFIRHKNGWKKVIMF